MDIQLRYAIGQEEEKRASFLLVSDKEVVLEGQQQTLGKGDIGQDLPQIMLPLRTLKTTRSLPS